MQIIRSKITFNPAARSLVYKAGFVKDVLSGKYEVIINTLEADSIKNIELFST